MRKRKPEALKRIASAMVAAVLAVGLMPLPAFAGDGGGGQELAAASLQAQDDEATAATVVEQGKCSESVSWAIYDDGSLHITGTGGMIGWRAWTDKPSNDNSATVKSIVFEQGITALAPLAFHNDGDMFVFPNVETIELSEGLTTIGHFAFGKASKLEAVYLPSTVTLLGNGVFNSCSALTDIYIAALTAPQLGSVDPNGSSYPMLTWSGSTWSKDSMNSWSGETERFYYGDKQPGDYFCWSQGDYGYYSDRRCPAGTLNSALRVHIPVGSSGYKEAVEDVTYTWDHVKQHYAFVESANVTAEFEALPALKAAKAEAKAELTAYKDEKAADASDDLVAALGAAEAAGLAGIDAATDVDGVASALAHAKSVMDVAGAIVEAKAELAAYVEERAPSFPGALKDSVEVAAAAGVTAIGAAETEDAVAAALVAAKAAIDAALSNGAGTDEEIHGDVVREGVWSDNATYKCFQDNTVVFYPNSSGVGLGDMFDYDETAYNDFCNFLSESNWTFVVGDGVVSLPELVFNGYPVVNVVLPAGLTDMASAVFDLNQKPTIWFASETAPSIGSNALGGAQTIYIPKGAERYGNDENNPAAGWAAYADLKYVEYTTAAQIDELRTAAIADLDAIGNNLSAYRDAEKALAQEAIAAAKAELRNAYNENAIAAAKKTATDAIAELKTDAQLTLDEAIAAAEAIDKSGLTDEQKRELDDAIDAAKAAATAEGATPESIAAAVGAIQLKAAKAEAAVAKAEADAAKAEAKKAQEAADEAADQAQKAAKAAEDAARAACKDAGVAYDESKTPAENVAAATTAQSGKVKAAQDAAKAAEAKAAASEKAAQTAKEAQAKAEKAQKAASGVKANTMTVKAKTVKAKAKKKTTVAAKKAFTVKSAKGNVSFYKLSGNAKIKVSSKGKVTVAKGLKAGKTYKVKVLVAAKGGKVKGVTYAPAFKTVTLKVKVAKK